MNEKRASEVFQGAGQNWKGRQQRPAWRYFKAVLHEEFSKAISRREWIGRVVIPRLHLSTKSRTRCNDEKTYVHYQKVVNISGYRQAIDSFGQSYAQQGGFVSRQCKAERFETGQYKTFVQECLQSKRRYHYSASKQDFQTRRDNEFREKQIRQCFRGCKEDIGNFVYENAAIVCEPTNSPGRPSYFVLPGSQCAECSRQRKIRDQEIRIFRVE